MYKFKVCNACHLEKRLEEYSKDIHRPDKKSSKCRLCEKEKRKASRIDNPLQKECKVCHEFRSLSDFKYRTDRGYYEKRCVVCVRKKLYLPQDVYIKGEKKCSKCGKYKTFEHFNKKTHSKRSISSKCKECVNILGKIKRDSVPEGKRRKLKKEDYLKYKDSYLKYQKEYRLNHLEKIKQYRRKREKNLKYTHPLLYLSRNISSNIRGQFKITLGGKYTKGKRTKDILGVDMYFFKKHIESQFLNWMKWDNYGNVCKDNNSFNCSFDLDHIIPISLAKTEEELYLLNHWSNFQPLCSRVNRIVKSNKTPDLVNIVLKIGVREGLLYYL